MIHANGTKIGCNGGPLIRMQSVTALEYSKNSLLMNEKKKTIFLLDCNGMADKVRVCK